MCKCVVDNKGPKVSQFRVEKQQSLSNLLFNLSNAYSNAIINNYSDVNIILSDLYGIILYLGELDV